MQITSNEQDLRGVKVLVNGLFYAILQGSWERNYLSDELDYWLEVEHSEIPMSKVLASQCEILEMPPAPKTVDWI